MRGIPGGLRKGDLFVRYRRKGERRIFAGILRPDGEIASRDGRVDRPGEVFWLPPVTPGKIVAVGLNDREHALEMGKPLPREPLLFLKAVSSLGAHCGEVVYPAVSTRVDFEGEIALVVGRRADHIPPREAERHLFGICAANDITARDIQSSDIQYTRAKSFPGFCPVGPAVLVGGTPEGCSVVTRVNGKVRQKGHVSSQIFGWEDLLSYISHMMPLDPGDIVLTGTYRGVGAVLPGDVVTVEVSGTGIPLKSTIVADPRPGLFSLWPGKKSAPSEHLSAHSPS
jgi:2-keto-4-pentenoate hydratase/2-oxohepta-3-ene-1,7-dioic acid hydratase in catechol pathway